MLRYDLETTLYNVFAPGKCWRLDPVTKRLLDVEWEGAHAEIDRMLSLDYPRPHRTGDGIVIDKHVIVTFDYAKQTFHARGIGKMKKEVLAIVLAVGDDPKEVAEKLRAIAFDIEAGNKIEHSDGQDRTMVRDAISDGEIPFFGRYYGVGYDGEGIDAPVALFAYKKDAMAYANGGTYEDEDNKPSTDGIVTRCDVVMTMWNNCDPDPVK